MAKVQYITDCNGEKIAIILPINDYNEVYQLVKKAAALSGIKVAYDLLELPVNVRNFIDSLICLQGIDWNIEVILTDEKISKVVKYSTKKIERNREALKNYVENKVGKAIVEELKVRDEKRRCEGSIYKLNIVQSIYEAIEDYTEEKGTDFKEFCRVAKDLGTFNLEKRSEYNKPFRELIDFIEKHISQLPNEAKIEPSEVTKGAITTY